MAQPRLVGTHAKKLKIPFGRQRSQTQSSFHLIEHAIRIDSTVDQGGQRMGSAPAPYIGLIISSMGSVGRVTETRKRAWASVSRSLRMTIIACEPVLVASVKGLYMFVFWQPELGLNPSSRIILPGGGLSNMGSSRDADWVTAKLTLAPFAAVCTPKVSAMVIAA